MSCTSELTLWHQLFYRHPISALPLLHCWHSLDQCPTRHHPESSPVKRSQDIKTNVFTKCGSDFLSYHRFNIRSNGRFPHIEVFNNSRAIKCAVINLLTASCRTKNKRKKTKIVIKVPGWQFTPFTWFCYLSSCAMVTNWWLGNLVCISETKIILKMLFKLRKIL